LAEYEMPPGAIPAGVFIALSMVARSPESWLVNKPLYADEPVAEVPIYPLTPTENEMVTWVAEASFVSVKAVATPPKCGVQD
jgi:hypothetical protein